MSNDEIGEWAGPYEMNLTYAFLYNTFDVGNSLYLPNQMQENFWRLVYGPSVRDRKLCWADVAAFFQSTRGRGWRERFAKPTRTFDDTTKRSFEIQNTDAYLCAMHSMNNIANTVIFSPPDLLSAIEMVRPLAQSKFASLEEVTLMSLREGVFLLPLRLVDAADLNPLDATETLPRKKFCLQLIEQARGMIIFMPLPGSQSIGHFVSLVYAEPSEGGTPPANRWLIYNSGQVVARGSTAAAALDKFILQRLSTGVDYEAGTREQRRRALQEKNISSERFVGLLPISLRLLRKDALLRGRLGAPRETRVEDFCFTEYVELVAQRTLVRRSLSEMRAMPVPGSNDSFELTIPDPVSPGAIDDLYWFVRVHSTVDENATDYSAAPINGFDQVNIASFYLTRHTADVELNSYAERIAALVMREMANEWTAETLGARRSALTVDQRYQAMVEQLAQLRSNLYDPTASLGLFLSGVSSTRDSREDFDKFTQLLPNRRWFRYIAITIAASALIGELQRAREEGDFPLRVSVRQLLMLFCSTAQARSLVAYGVKQQATPALGALFAAIDADRTLLPLGSLPDSLEDAVVRHQAPAPGTRSEFQTIFQNVNYDWCMWLLRATRDTNLSTYALPSLAPFEILSPSLDDDEDVEDSYDIGLAAYDHSLRFVRVLRSTLFHMPFSDKHTRLMSEYFYEQEFNQPTRPYLAEHYHHTAQRFIEMALKEKLVADEREAMRWIDVLAFDNGFASAGWRESARNVATHDISDDARPRFVERAAQAGFDRLRRRVFGDLYLLADDRTPITNNARRLPLPAVAGNWRATRPVVSPEAQLLTAALSDLRLYNERDAFLESITITDSESSTSVKRPRLRRRDDDSE